MTNDNPQGGEQITLELDKLSLPSSELIDELANKLAPYLAPYLSGPLTFMLRCFDAGRESTQPAESNAVLLDVQAAAALLGISKSALYCRIERGQVKGVVRTGRRIQFHRELLLEKLSKVAK